MGSSQSSRPKEKVEEKVEKPYATSPAVLTLVPCPNSCLGANKTVAWTAAIDPLALTKGEKQYFALPCGCDQPIRHVGGVLGFSLQWLPSTVRDSILTHRLTVFTAGLGTKDMALPGRLLGWRNRSDNKIQSWTVIRQHGPIDPLPEDVKVNSALDSNGNCSVTWRAIYEVKWLPFVQEWSSMSNRLMLNDFSWQGPNALEFRERQEMVNLVDQALSGILTASSTITKTTSDGIWWPEESLNLRLLTPAELETWMAAIPKITTAVATPIIN